MTQLISDFSVNKSRNEVSIIIILISQFSLSSQVADVLS